MLVATPSFAALSGPYLAVISVAAALGAARTGNHGRRQRAWDEPEVRRALSAALMAIGIAAVAAWFVVLVAALLDPKFGHATAFNGALVLIGAPAWMAQGLALGSAAPMTVRATVLGIGPSRQVGLFTSDQRAVVISVVMLVILLGAATWSGRWYARGVGHDKRADAAFIGLPFSLLLSLWVASSGLTIAGRLGAAVAVIGQVLTGGLLGLVPIAGSTLSHLGGSLLSHANQSGLSVVWATSAFIAFLGSLVLVSGGAWVGSRSAPLEPRPAPASLLTAAQEPSRRGAGRAGVPVHDGAKAPPGDVSPWPSSPPQAPGSPGRAIDEIKR